MWDRGQPRALGRGASWPALIAAVAVFAIAPAGASAAVDIYESSEAATHLGAIEKAKCAVKGKKGSKRFRASGKSPNGWELDVYILEGFWRGVKDDYTLFYGDSEVGFVLAAPDFTLYSNFPIPATPPGIVPGGAIDFGRNGKKLGIGFSAAPSSDFTKGVAFAGGLKCEYKRKFRP
jgi:hypothetical protein